MSWNVSGLKLWADLILFNIPIPFLNTDVPVTVTLDVIQFTSDFELNSIPKGNIQLALGRRADDVTIAASIHKIIQYMKLQLPITVYLQGQNLSDDGTVEPWPTTLAGDPKPFIVFDGLTTGSTYVRTMQGASFGLSMTHWLENLNFSSMSTQLFQPLNPKQYSFFAAIPDIASGGTSIVSTTAAHEHFNSTVVVNDLWGYKSPVPFVPGTATSGGLKQWFTELSNLDVITSLEINTIAGIPTAGANNAALAALNKIEPIPNINPAGGPFGNNYLDGVPLALNVAALFSPQLAEQIAEMIGTETPFTLASYTMWDKLVGVFGPNFMFSLVPQVEKALVVPFIPGLRTTYATIAATDYDYIQLNAAMPRILRGVALSGGSRFMAGGDLSGNTDPVYNTVGGWYQGQPEGTILLKDLPQWLANVSSAYLDVYGTTGIGSPIATSVFPASGPPAVVPRNLFELFTAAKTLWDDYAHALYMMEILRGRYGTVSGKLRFDIAPGSNIIIEGSDDPFVDGALGETVFGNVLRVSTAINAETQRAGTAFHVAYIRDTYENSTDNTSIDSHPFWTNAWTGAPLANLK